MSKRKSSPTNERSNKRAKPRVDDEEDDDEHFGDGDQSDPLLSNQACNVSVFVVYVM